MQIARRCRLAAVVALAGSAIPSNLALAAMPLQPPCSTRAVVRPTHQVIPANVPAFIWEPSSPTTAEPPDEQFGLLRAGDGLRVERMADGRRRLVPLIPLRPGQSYDLFIPRECYGVAASDSFPVPF